MTSSIQIAKSDYQFSKEKPNGKYITLLGENYYCIENYDQMPPFFMSLVSNTDHWNFISSSGGLTAGRGNAESAVFPYTTDDKVVLRVEDAHVTDPIEYLAKLGGLTSREKCVIV